MRVAITGASGLIGQALSASLEHDGHTVTRVTRDPERSRRTRDTIHWNPREGSIDRAGLEGHDVVIHLAAENLFGVWTRAKRERIRNSRVQGTQLLAAALAALDSPPALLIAASAMGYYGDRPPDEPLDESAAPGHNFTADVVRQWEAAAQPAETAGIRVAHLRMGLVLSADGGVLRLLLPLFRLGLGGVPGSGRQVWSWIALPDVPPVVRRIMDDDTLRGPVNVAAPNPVSAREFSETLGRVLHRPVLLRVPAPLLSLTPGHMGREMALVSSRMVPAKLQQRGHVFQHPHYEPALRAVLDR